LLLLILPAVPQEKTARKPDPQPSIDELAAGLPRIRPLAPADSRAKIIMRKGFHVETVAAEPLVRDPVAVDFDEHGRMFVCELPQYNGYAIEEFNEDGFIRMLEDKDGDGRFETSTVFADHLDYPTAVACWDGGVFVGAAPDLLYLKDTDGDGQADTRTVVFTGYGKDRAGESHLNSFRWGFDNRFHFSTNLSGGDIRVASEEPASAVSVRSRGFLFDPRDLSGFQLTSGGGQHGMSMDNWGRKFVCSNSVPAQMLMYDDRYLARNPHVRAPTAAVDIAPQGKFTKLFRMTPDEPWRKLRTNLRKTGRFRGSDEGGKPFGFFTGATGITIYRGDAWPQEFRGNLLVGDVANNLIYRATLKPSGVGFVAERADAEAEFLASTEIWFRPVQMANAPDGSLFVLDIYRELIEGAAFLPPEFIKHLDPVGGNDRGRIYRIVPDGFQQRKLPDFVNATVQELVALLDHPNGWHRDTASRLIYQRQDRATVPALKKMAVGGQTAEGRRGALFALQGLGWVEEADVLSALDDKSPLVRSGALKIAESIVVESPLLTAKLCGMADDDDLRIRYQLAFSLGVASGREVTAALVRLAEQDGSDPWMQLAIQTSLHSEAGTAFAELSGNEAFRATSHGQTILKALAGQIGHADRQDEIAIVLRSLQRLPVAAKPLAESLVQALVKEQQGPAREQLLSAAGGRAGEILGELLKTARQTADNDDKPLEERIAAIRTLKLSSFEAEADRLGKLLNLQQPGRVQSAVLETLGEFSSERVAILIVAQWRGFSPLVRTQATETLLSRPAWISTFLTAVEEGSVGRGDVSPSRIELLRRHPSETISARTQQLFGTASAGGKRAGVVTNYQSALKLSGEVDRGRAVFKKVCSACHRLEGVGTAVGADLKAIRNRGLSAVLLNVLDPNREVKPKFLAYVAVLNNGKTVTGMIEKETANSLTMRRPDGTQAEIRRGDIDELSSTGLSFMPEGLEKQIDRQAMADLLHYLDSIR
ncbi:MAG: PVC-type heme-binding CxxCH protein, partial [Planctomycetaceae bacterium]